MPTHNMTDLSKAYEGAMKSWRGILKGAVSATPSRPSAATPPAPLSEKEGSVPRFVVESWSRMRKPFLGEE